MAIIVTNANWLQVDGARLQKGKWDLSRISTGVRLSDAGERIDIPAIGTSIDGITPVTAEELFDFFVAQGFKQGGTGPGGETGVQSVTGNIVSGTAENPVVNIPTDISNHPERTDNPHNVTAEQVGLGNVDNTSDLNKPISTATLSALADKQSLSEKGQAGGYPSLDNSGKIPLEFLNVSGLTFKGAWDASTNTPTLLDGTGSVGDFYKVSVGGTYNFGNGEHTFAEGDWVMFAAGVWQRIGVHETVQSVNGKVGAVVINKSDIGLGNTDNTSDADKPVSTAQQQALNQKQDTLVSGTNIKTVAGHSLIGTGNIDLPGVSSLISSTVQDGFTINEYGDRIEYLTKIQAPNQTIGTGANRYSSHTSTARLPAGVSISGADWAEINIKNPNRAIDVCVYDNSSRYIVFGYFNNYNSSSSTVANPTAFIKLTNYK